MKITNSDVARPWLEAKPSNNVMWTLSWRTFLASEGSCFSSSSPNNLAGLICHSLLARKRAQRMCQSQPRRRVEQGPRKLAARPVSHGKRRRPNANRAERQARGQEEGLKLGERKPLLVFHTRLTRSCSSCSGTPREQISERSRG